MSMQLTHENVFPVLFEAVALQVGGDEALSSSTALQDDLGMDSLEVVELGVVLEKRFAIELPNAELRSCVTLDDVARLVMDTVQNQGRE